MTGSYNLDVMFDNAVNISEKMDTVLANYGYQDQSRTEDGYISTGVNWGYTATSLFSEMDAGTILSILCILVLILFTGYLIIYNVFQISVTNDIRFYGLLKTIGTTSRQIRRIVRQQALLLSIFGIPLGLIVGYGVGGAAHPGRYQPTGWYPTHCNLSQPGDFHTLRSLCSADRSPVLPQARTYRRSCLSH